MPVEIQSTMKPRNNGLFPLAEAVDIEVTEQKRLSDVLLYGQTNKGKFLVVGDDGVITASAVSVGSPIVVSDAATLDKILSEATEADLGKAYLYVGEGTEAYKNGALYVISEA